MGTGGAGPQTATLRVAQDRMGRGRGEACSGRRKAEEAAAHGCPWDVRAQRFSSLAAAGPPWAPLSALGPGAGRAV